MVGAGLERAGARALQVLGCSPDDRLDDSPGDRECTAIVGGVGGPEVAVGRWTAWGVCNAQTPLPLRDRYAGDRRDRCDRALRPQPMARAAARRPHRRGRDAASAADRSVDALPRL